MKAFNNFIVFQDN